MKFGEVSENFITYHNLNINGYQLCTQWRFSFTFVKYVIEKGCNRWFKKKTEKNFPNCCNRMCLLLINHLLWLIKATVSRVPSGPLQDHNIWFAMWLWVFRNRCLFSLWGHSFVYSLVYAHCICLSVLTQLLTHPGRHGQQLKTGTVFFTSPLLAFTP